MLVRRAWSVSRLSAALTRRVGAMDLQTNKKQTQLAVVTLCALNLLEVVLCVIPELHDWYLQKK